MFFQSQPLGISIGLRDVRYCLLKKGKPIQIQRAGILPLSEGLIREEGLSDPAYLYHEMKDWVKKERLAGRKAFLTLPAFHTFIRKIKVPVMKEKDLSRYLEVEITGSLYLPFEDPVFDYTLEKEGEGEEQTVILYATPRKILEDYLAVMEELSISISSVDIPALALLRHPVREGIHLEENLMILYLTQETIDLYMYYRQIPEFMRSIPLQQSHLSWGDALSEFAWNDTISEVRRMLNFYQFNMHEEEKMVTQLIVMGEHPGKERFIHLLAEGFTEIKIEPFSVRLPSGDGEREMNEYALPLGLALRGVKG